MGSRVGTPWLQSNLTLAGADRPPAHCYITASGGRPHRTTLGVMGAIIDTTKKRVERAYLELARAWYPAFPSGALVDSEAPDFLVATPDGQFGFEVTQLFQQPSNSVFAPREIESFRERVIRRAEEIYSLSGGPPVDVNAYFSLRPEARQQKEQVAQAFSEFVRANYPEDGQVLNFREGKPTSALPSGLGAVSIARPLLGGSRRWFAGGVGETKLLTYDLLAEAISFKNPLVAGYRARASKLWLLIAVDMFPFSASFSVPAEVNTWSFDYEFDQVLLLSRQESKVWALSSA